ncbi:MAG: hypothetical protein MR610_05930 [Olsenella sp.]|nr:hypothetical protein [Olsenella sp.]MDD6706809.1 hypothetical protein [Olsenella sp.]MDY4650714.1 hypothetical protein [Atopobiaceae bacterium]MDY5274266.1 hypothetical protein [Atopobiaceae bacterium]
MPYLIHDGGQGIDRKERHGIAFSYLEHTIIVECHIEKLLRYCMPGHGGLPNLASACHQHDFPLGKKTVDRRLDSSVNVHGLHLLSYMEMKQVE